ncbi:MAG: hypothetical protein NVSMB26_04300 [Beijerinckiaceae bacterium]
MPEVAARLGPFVVRAEAASVDAYRHMIGGHGRGVPAAFPICWLGRPDIRAAIETACGGRLPVHEGQSFDYERGLAVEGEYRLSLTLRREVSPPRLVLDGEVATAAGERCLTIATLLRLVAPTESEAA